MVKNVEKIEEDILDELKKRCDNAGIEISEFKSPIVGYDKMFNVYMKSGKEKKQLVFFTNEQIKKFLSIKFEKYRILNPYEAICSYDDKVIECAIRTIDFISIQQIKQRLGIQITGKKDKENLEIKLKKGNYNIRIGKASEDMRAIYYYYYSNESELSLKITGVDVNRHVTALSMLEDISNSLFFQIDLLSGLSFSLNRDIKIYKMEAKHPWFKDGNLIENIEYLKRKYDNIAMTLYWYAKSAKQMPLLQYLAYYQVIEYYFSTYSQMEGIKEIRKVLKDPTFSEDNDKDISNILSVVPNRTGGIGNEANMLEATLNVCVNESELREFILENKGMAEFIGKKIKGLTDIIIPIKNENEDLRKIASKRIYDIRCKIVHYKGAYRGKDENMLLPFSKESEQLGFDIDLICYLGRRVLINSSTKFI